MNRGASDWSDGVFGHEPLAVEGPDEKRVFAVDRRSEIHNDDLNFCMSNCYSTRFPSYRVFLGLQLLALGVAVAVFRDDKGLFGFFNFHDKLRRKKSNCSGRLFFALIIVLFSSFSIEGDLQTTSCRPSNRKRKFYRRVATKCPFYRAAKHLLVRCFRIFLSCLR